MYEAFWGLARLPFRRGGTRPFWSDGHADAYGALRYAVSARVPVACLTGAPGTGKTCLLDRLEAELAAMLPVLRVPPWALSTGSAAGWVRDALAAAEPGRRLVMVDEAQALEAAALEALRLAVGRAGPQDPEAQLILAGGPELRGRLAEPALAHLAQRIGVDAVLEPLSAADSAEYITWRMIEAGATRTVFDEEAARAIHLATGGNPRLIGTLADLALARGFAEGARQVDRDLVRAVMAEAEAADTYPALVQRAGLTVVRRNG